MVFLFLSILCSTINTGVVKYGEVRQRDRINVMSVNYLVATGLAAVGWYWEHPFFPSLFTVGLGAMGGVFYAGALFLFMAAIGRAGMALSTTAMRMGVIWPVLLSILIFGEVPTLSQTLGVLLAFMAMGSLAFTSSNPLTGSGGRHLGWLTALFLAMGGTGITLKLFTELGVAEERPALLTFIFLFSGLLTWGFALARRRTLTRGELSGGFLFGVNNVLSNTFLLKGLALVPGVLAFPLINSGILLAAALLGVAVWKEQPGVAGYTAMLLSLIALVLILG